MADIPDSKVAVVERGGSGMSIALAVIALALLAVVSYFVFVQTRNDNARTDAVTSAAHQVGDTAKKAGDAIDEDK